ncbi:hypothetical protein ES705_11426 [subsurface metagenome]
MDRKNDKEFFQGAGQHIFTPRRLIISFTPVVSGCCISLLLHNLSRLFVTISRLRETVSLPGFYVISE